MPKDEHAHGQHEEAKSRNNSIFDEAIDQIFGHGRYDAPSNSDGKDQFFKGTKNAGDNPPKK